jgi:hypothetical protein
MISTYDERLDRCLNLVKGGMMRIDAMKECAFTIGDFSRAVKRVDQGRPFVPGRPSKVLSGSLKILKDQIHRMCIFNGRGYHLPDMDELVHKMIYLESLQRSTHVSEILNLMNNC